MPEYEDDDSDSLALLLVGFSMNVSADEDILGL